MSKFLTPMGVKIQIEMQFYSFILPIHLSLLSSVGVQFLLLILQRVQETSHNHSFFFLHF